jgi:hypothetical protein
MRSWSRAAARLFVAGLAALLARPIEAQSVTLSIAGVRGDSISPAPLMTVSALQTRPELGPFTVSLELSSDPGFARPFYFNSNEGLIGTFAIDSLLPERSVVFMRARLIDRQGTVTETRQRYAVRNWITLVQPIQQPLTHLSTRTPRFVWTSPVVTLPPGPWVYDLAIINNGSNTLAKGYPDLTDTSFQVTEPLEANASYRWQVIARAQNSKGTGEVVARSSGTFLITSATQPTATIFYQNFPNPFGRGERTNSTCFWFDLGGPATVRLTIYDLRLRRVRQLIPGTLPSGVLPAGAYGREPSMQTGCDTRLLWDGKDDSGRIVPAGIYIAEFVADGQRSTKKVYFKGQ